jgi:hypothetical protein
MASTTYILAERKRAGRRWRADPHSAQRTAIDARITEDEMTGWWHEQRVRERAYEIWESTGRPEGKAGEHWLQAEAEVAAEEQGLEQEVRLESEGAV